MARRRRTQAMPSRIHSEACSRPRMPVGSKNSATRDEGDGESTDVSKLRRIEQELNTTANSLLSNRAESVKYLSAYWLNEDAPGDPQQVVYPSASPPGTSTVHTKQSRRYVDLRLKPTEFCQRNQSYTTSPTAGVKVLAPSRVYDYSQGHACTTRESE